MNRTLIIVPLLTLLMLAPGVQAQEAETLLGRLDVQDLLMLPGWFGTDYRSYSPSKIYLDRLPEQMHGVQILCIMGTWCSDSRREVPRMIKLIQALKLPPEALAMIGVDREKRAPGGEALEYNIELVPTFIVLRDGVDIGRIVERPYSSLEKDLLGILDPQPEPEPMDSDAAGNATGAGGDADAPHMKKSHEHPPKQGHHPPPPKQAVEPHPEH